MSKLRIENILIDNDYILADGLGYYSSIVPGGVRSLYSKNGIMVIVGLNEKGHPPTLIHPRPTKTSIEGKYNIIRQMSDAEVIGWLEKSSDEEIINFIENYERAF